MCGREISLLTGFCYKSGLYIRFDFKFKIEDYNYKIKIKLKLITFNFVILSVASNLNSLLTSPFSES
jgi:hypothetical protein